MCQSEHTYSCIHVGVKEGEELSSKKIIDLKTTLIEI